jgi:hypothetical protein
VTAIELSDHTPLAELALVRSTASRYGAIVVSSTSRIVWQRPAGLAEPLVRLLRDVGRAASQAGTPMVTTFFGNPYVAAAIPELPAVLLTYDFYDMAEASAVRAIAGEAAIGGKLPIALPGSFPIGHGLDRMARTTSPQP